LNLARDGGLGKQAGSGEAIASYNHLPQTLRKEIDYEDTINKPV
jgi:hypothetical protein